MLSSIVYPHPAVRRESSNRIGWSEQKWSVFGVLGASYPKGCQMFRALLWITQWCHNFRRSYVPCGTCWWCTWRKIRPLGRAIVGRHHQTPKMGSKKDPSSFDSFNNFFLYSFVHSLPFIHAGVKTSTGDTKRNKCRHQLLILRHCWRFWKTLLMELWGLYESISFKSFNIHVNI